MVTSHLPPPSIPYGLVVRIPAFHAGGPGSIPGVGGVLMAIPLLQPAETCAEGVYLKREWLRRHSRKGLQDRMMFNASYGGRPEPYRGLVA